MPERSHVLAHVKRMAFAVSPRTAIAVQSQRARRRSHRLVEQWGLRELNHRVAREFGTTVVNGPFKGLKLTASAFREHVGPYLLGTYECELHDAWDSILRSYFSQIVDIGSNFGYYAAGLAMRFPGTDTIAFDTDWWARRAVREMRRANELSNLRVKAFCSPSWLSSDLRPGSLVVSDCEGFEGELFGDHDAAAFATSTFVIELHDQFVPGVTEKIRERFGRTHALQEIHSRAESIPPQARSLTHSDMARAAHEIRSPQQWFVLRPRSR